LNCPECGAETSPEMKFCPKCGAAIGAVPQPIKPRIRERGPDIIGLVSAGAILIIIGLAYVRNPIDPSVITDYFQRMGTQRTFIKPPSVLFDAAIFLFYAVGVWSIVLSGLRIIFQRSVRNALGDLIGGFFSFFVAFLLTSYAEGVFTGRVTLAYFVIAIGVLVILNAALDFALKER